MDAEARARLRHTAMASKQAHGNWGVVSLRAQDAVALLDAMDATERERDAARAVVARLRAAVGIAANSLDGIAAGLRAGDGNPTRLGLLMVAGQLEDAAGEARAALAATAPAS